MSTSTNLLAWQNQLITNFEAAAGIRFAWENETSAWEAFPRGEFSGPFGVQEVGRDYIQFQHPAPGQAFPKTVGRRTGMVLCRVFSRNQTATDKAWVYLERVRMALKHPDVIDAWNLIGMSLAYTSDIRLADAKGTSDRMESIGTMEITLNLLPDALLGDVDVGTIEHVGVSSTGLPTNMDEVIPPLP